MDVIDILGVVAAAGFVMFYAPQLLTIWRAPRLEGFNLGAWACLLVAVLCLTAQLVLLQAWTGVAANAFSTLAVAATMLLIWRKNR